MKALTTVGVFLLLYVPAGFALVGAGAALTMPVRSLENGAESPSAGPSTGEQRREQIRALHSAYRAALAELDWSAGENGHSADTIRQARELHFAMQQEIMDILHRTSSTGNAAGKACPYSGESRPVRTVNEPGTYRL